MNEKKMDADIEEKKDVFDLIYNFRTPDLGQITY